MEDPIFPETGRHLWRAANRRLPAPIWNRDLRGIEPCTDVESISRDFDAARGEATPAEIGSRVAHTVRLPSRLRVHRDHRARKDAPNAPYGISAACEECARSTAPLNSLGVIQICRLRLAPVSGISALMELWPSG